MHVHVRSRLSAVRLTQQRLLLSVATTYLVRVFGLGYKTVYDDHTAVRAVLQDFAKRFSLPANVCTVWQLQNKLSGSTMLWQVWL